MSNTLSKQTIAPARIMGMADKIGSLEPGKDADILILDGSPMDYRTWVETAIVNGRPVYNRTEDKIMPRSLIAISYHGECYLTKSTEWNRSSSTLSKR